jgi:hypothetical protein
VDLRQFNLDHVTILHFSLSNKGLGALIMPPNRHLLRAQVTDARLFLKHPTANNKA